ncbi:conserved transmembrane transport MmpL13 domain protein [Mycobacterium intracellulare]|nr:conserved transmembrane transport MmpL13 domain protein [Mycobacterium intracellulare]
MLQKIARVAIAAPRRIIAIGVLVFIAAAVFGVPVAKSLSPGGFQDPDSESARAIAVLTDKFGQSGQQMLILVTAPAAPTANRPARWAPTSSTNSKGPRWSTTCPRRGPARPQPIS